MTLTAPSPAQGAPVTGASTTGTTTAAPPAAAVVPGPEVSIEEFTPDYCAWVLDNRNRNPRRLRRDKAAQYGADMAAGNWAVGAGNIAFDEEGYLRDGQHRFAGSVMSGRPFTSIVIRGVSQEAIDNADRGLKRAVADILRGAGEVNVTALQSAISMGCRWDERGALSNWTPTWPQMNAWLQANPNIRQAVVDSMTTIHPPLSVRGSVMAPFIYRINQIDPDAKDVFLRRFGAGVDLQPGDAILKLRDLFLKRAAQVYGRPSKTYDLAVMIKAFNAFITGKQLRVLKWNRGGGVRQENFPFLTGPDGAPWPFPDYLRELERADGGVDIDDEPDDE